MSAPSPEWFREIFDSALLGIYASRSDGTLIWCNEAFARILGFDSVEQVLAIFPDDALKKMLDYVKRNYKDENSYTIQWTSINSNELHTSYFRAKNMYQALDKLYYGRDINTISVYIIKLNPIS